MKEFGPLGGMRWARPPSRSANALSMGFKARVDARCPPPGSRFLRFDIQNFRNITASGVSAPSYEVDGPPTGNPGSATAIACTLLLLACKILRVNSGQVAAQTMNLSYVQQTCYQMGRSTFIMSLCACASNIKWWTWKSCMKNLCAKWRSHLRYHRKLWWYASISTFLRSQIG